MSRPKRASLVYGMVVLRCPFDHAVGRVMRKDTGRYSIVDGEFLSRDVFGPILSVRCLRCESRGVVMDLRGSWPKVRALADELQADPNRNVEYYRLGG